MMAKKEEARTEHGYMKVMAREKKAPIEYVTVIHFKFHVEEKKPLHLVSQ